MLNRLSTRLVLSHLLVIAVAMALLGFLLLSLVRSYFVQAMQQSLTIQARLTAGALGTSDGLALSNLVPALLPPASNALQQQGLNRQYAAQGSGDLDLAALANAQGQFSSLLDLRIEVTDAQGIVLADSLGTDLGRDLGADPLIAAALEGRERGEARGDTLHVATPLRRGGQGAGVIYVSQPMADIAAVLADLRARLLVSAAAALALSALVGLFLARAIARPVADLTRAADHLATGDFDYPLAAGASDELGRLANSFQTMRDELRRTLQARADLVTNVSHELRTPLTAIKGLVETLRDGAVDDLAARDRFLASIERQTDRLIRLVNDLLVLSRADARALPLHRERFDLVALARSCADELGVQAVAGDVVIAVEGPPAVVSADPDRIRQVIINLLDNALRFSPRGERVRVRVTPSPGAVTVTVQDWGPGIPAADQPRVFERFYRADRSRQRAASSTGGSGLGLAIAQVLVEAHGGTVALESRESEGTTVKFTLPVA